MSETDPLNIELSEASTPPAKSKVAKTRQRGRRLSASPLLGDTLVSRSLQVLIAIALTFVISDLLLKQNYERYLTERTATAEAIREANIQFDGLILDIQNMFAERVYAAQIMNDLAAANNVSRFMSYYATYYTTVEQWNLQKNGVETRIRAYTGCDGTKDDSSIGLAIKADILNPTWELNAATRYQSANRVSAFEFYTRSDRTRYCPDVLLFGARERTEITNTDDLWSAFEALRIIHGLFVDNTRRTVTLCSQAAEAIRTRKLHECTPRTLEFRGKSVTLGVRECLRASMFLYAEERLCPNPWYLDLADIKLQRFATINYRIEVALRMLEHYRFSFVARACEDQRGFWSRLTGYNCDEEARNMRVVTRPLAFVTATTD
jgi:hypothetical protein